jgi:hypothetical protein
MKKRVKLSNANPYYSNEAAVSRTMIADKPGFPTANQGGSTPKMVDKKPGRMSGFAGFESKSHPKAPAAHIKTVPLGNKDTKGVPQQGSLRTSGHPKAHQLGGIKKIKRI